MKLGEEDGEGRHPRAILHRRAYRVREGTAMDATTGTGPGHGAILGDLAADHEFGDLATLGQGRRGKFTQILAARAGSRQGKGHVMIGLRHEFQRRTRMLLLPPGLLATVRPQGFGYRFLEGGIRGRWFAGVVAILGQAGFQFLNALLQLLNQGRLFGNQGT